MRRICIVGGGSHGVTAAEACTRIQNVDYEIYEICDLFDGSWPNQWRESTSGTDSALSMSSSERLTPVEKVTSPEENQQQSAPDNRNEIIEKLAKIGCLSRLRFRHKVVGVEKSDTFSEDGLWRVKVQNLVSEDGGHTVETFHAVLDCTKRYGIPLISFPTRDELLGDEIIGAYRALARLRGINETVLEVGHSQTGGVSIDLSKAYDKAETSIEMGPSTAATGSSPNMMHTDWIKYIEDLGKLVDKTLTVSSALGANRAMSSDETGRQITSSYRRLPDSRAVTVGERADAKMTREMLEYLECDPKLLDKHEDSEVAAYYAGRSVFLTGVSGFIGKTILEKLLRSCPRIGDVFLLMRAKRGKQVGERLGALFESALFDRLRKLDYGQSQIAKVRAIEGDITKPLLGVSSADLSLLLEANTSVIINSAASVKFIDPLKTLVENNVLSLGYLIDLASKLPKLEALVHVSTAYGNCNRKHIDEVVYDQPVDAETVLEMVKRMSASSLEKIAPGLLDGRPNKYTFTKSIGESLLMERTRVQTPNLPVAIVRPSITAGAWREPVRGWVDNYNASTGVLSALATGMLQVTLTDGNCGADLVPVDLVANLTICAARQIHEQHKSSRGTSSTSGRTTDHEGQPAKSLRRCGNVTVFNCVSGQLNPITWRDFVKHTRRMALTYPVDKMLRTPEFFLFSCPYSFAVYNFVNHKLFAYSWDFLLQLIGINLKLVEKYKLTELMVDIMRPFTLNEWSFGSSNMSSLYEWLSPVDKELFNFDVRQVEWRDYLERYYIGTKLFVLKDEPSRVHKSKVSLYRRYWWVQLIQISLMFIAGFVLFQLFL